MNRANVFAGRKLVIATKHEKERVIAPVLESALEVKCVVPENIDTDAFGTFSGEKERTDDPITTVRKKCLTAMELTACDLAVGSEGSFGAHPGIFYAAADDEILMLLDKKNNLEIVVREMSADTNFSAAHVHNQKQLLDFAQKALFPSHALIIKKDQNDTDEMVKGITTREQLLSTFQRFMKDRSGVYVETDMRAMYNPTRMKVIEQAAHKLAQRANTYCPQCHMPGFGVTEVKQGLPCELCQSATRSILSHIYTCQVCSYRTEKMYPYGKQTENPMYCDICNP